MRVTISGIAAKAGVSSTTVSFVLNGREKGIAAATRERVIRIAEEMGYRKLPQANLQGWTRVAFLTHDIAHFNSLTSFFSGVFSHLQQQGFSRRVEVSLQELSFSSREETWTRIEAIRGLGYDLFLTNHKALARLLKRRGVPVILLQGAAPERGFFHVHCDNYRAGALAAEAVLARGHHRAGLLFPEGGGAGRDEGFRTVFEAGGGRILKRHDWRVSWDHAAMEEAIRRKAGMKTLPPVFYCFADYFLFPAIRAFRDRGIRLPEDVGLIGTDNLYWGRCANPSFTTVDLEEELFAKTLLDIIPEVLHGAAPRRIAVPVRWIPRESF